MTAIETISPRVAALAIALDRAVERHIETCADTTAIDVGLAAAAIIVDRLVAISDPAERKAAPTLRAALARTVATLDALIDEGRRVPTADCRPEAQ